MILLNLSILHSPCVSEGCTVEYKHCSGCNESFPCKSRQVLDGKTVAQLNEMIEGLKTVTVYGDQEGLEDLEDSEDLEDDAATS
jgi:hypothetical protein